MALKKQKAEEILTDAVDDYVEPPQSAHESASSSEASNDEEDAANETGELGGGIIFGGKRQGRDRQIKEPECEELFNTVKLDVSYIAPEFMCPPTTSLS